MKKLTLLFLFALTIVQYAKAQSFWAYTAGSIKEDETMDICYDNSGNIISVGYIAGQTSFGPGVVLNTSSSGNPDVYVSKSNAAGQIIWAVKAGGSGSDRATSVATDGSGNIYITGFYYATANFGSTILTSVSGSQDGFLAKLDANGNFLWAKSFGGTLAEWGNSVTTDHNGNPIVTGQFQGTANFSGSTVTSIINPNTSFSSFDVFVAKYTPAGNISWINTGKAKFDDRGLDVITDLQNNIYVCGQFSDTIQFNNLHTNTIMNAVFIIKYDQTGQELWWRKAAGVFSIANSMVMDNASNIYITGDFQGTLTYFGVSSMSFVNGLYSNKAFILKIDNAGSFIWGKADASNNYLSSKNIALDAQQDPYIFGEFGCTHNEYSAAYGTGVFNSIGFQDFFITKYNNTGTRQWFRHYGGPRNDKAHGLLIAGINEPIMSGSYETRLNIPSTYATIAAINNTLTTYGYLAQQPTTYCSAPNNYNDYLQLDCKGYSDMFIHKGVDLNRNPYDYYERSGITCNLGFVGNCISGGMTAISCPDTVNLCLNGRIYSNSKTTNNGLFGSSYPYFNQIGIGPFHQYKWNNNINDTLQSLLVSTSGYKTVEVKTLDGCYSSKDTVYVKINSLPPPPTITDSYGANTLQLPLTNSISVCGPTTITLTGGSIQNTLYSWIGSAYLTNHDSVSTINASGIYTFQVVDSNGCYNFNKIKINIFQPIAPFIPKQKNDTVKICQGFQGLHIVCDSITNPLLNYPYSTCISHQNVLYTSTSPGLSISNVSPCNLSFNVSATTSGNYTYTVGYVIDNLCSHDTIYFTGHVYILVKPKPTGTIVIGGNPLICPGDSTLISITSVSVSPNTTFTINPSSSIWVHNTSSVYYTMQMKDTISGCSNVTGASIFVSVKPNPFIILNPYNSIICPNDSMKLTINLPGATNYEWHGPAGIIPSNTQTIYTQIAGFYHCIVTDNTGCVFTTNTVEVKQYATPYLISTPTNVICNNQPLSLHVITLDSTLINWFAPLSGSGATKVITTPGNYSCSVTMCNIITPLSIQIIGSNPVATISASGPLTVCPFDSITLTGNSGMTNYIWQPGNHLGQNYTIHTAGIYTLEVTDGYGCTKKSTPVTVSFTSSIAPPINAINDTICIGQSAALSVTSVGGNTVHWFPNASSGFVLGTGTSYTTNPLSNQTTFYAASVSSSGCHSFGIPVTAYIYQTSTMPVLTADTTICKGDTLKITTPFIAGASYIWTGNSITTNTTNTVVIPNADSTYNGIYTLQISGFGCISAISSVSIQVLNPLLPSITGNDSICQNSSYTYAISPSQNNYAYNWVGPNSFTSTNDSLIITSAQVNQTGTYTVTSNLLGCFSTPSTIHLTVLQTPTTPIITSNSQVCVGDTIHLSVVGSNPAYTYTWFGQNNFSSTQPQTYVVATDTTYTGFYGVIATNAFCPSTVAFDTVQVLPYPTLTVTNDTIACDNIALILQAQSNYTNYSWNTNATSNTISVTQSGTYWVTSSNGTCSITDSVHVTMAPCGQVSINVFTPNGDGSNDVFKFSSLALLEIHCEITDRWGEKVGEFDGPSNGWNGQHMASKINCTEGTYFYVAQIKTIDGVAQTIKGFLTLFR